MTLAIHGGKPVRTRLFPERPSLSYDVLAEGAKALFERELSGFIADDPEGGPRVRALEAKVCEQFKIKHAIAMNSATSALCAAVRTLGIGPGDEVIVPAWTMSASAACVTLAGATPVFADIESETFGLDASSVSSRITLKTKAIIAVDLFGCIPMQWDKLCQVATTPTGSRSIPIIEDAAQAIGGCLYGRPAGTLGNIGIYSFNRHKILQVGEGGIAVTNDDTIAEGLKAARNHGEVREKAVGQNYRMGEIEAALALPQLEGLYSIIIKRGLAATMIFEGLADIKEIEVASPPQNCLHAWYLQAIRVKETFFRKLLAALQAEGIPITKYVKPLHWLSGFRRPDGKGHFSQEPEVERTYREVLVHPFLHEGITPEDIEDIISAFRKIWEHRGDL